ncbi:hypothetical protein VM1G_11714 [Cytospora mali]|uniref:Uncharacterized protein n=1 Tax=Cytospora mali TaxID=578113 RepID=A0A194W343_CYTMA|nr:hypothetical protein VM1G_11714 [Valsa mali]
MAPPSSLSRGNHADFMKQRQPKPLTASQRAALRQQLKAIHFLKPDFTDSTKKKVIQKADRAIAMEILYYLCETYNIKFEGIS